MGKRILLGSMLVLTLLLLMPSIPAIQQKTIEESEFGSLLTQLEGNDNPILFLLLRIFVFRALRGLYFDEISTEPSNSGYGFYVIHPLIYIRGLWLFFTGFVLASLDESIIIISNPKSVIL